MTTCSVNSNGTLDATETGNFVNGLEKLKLSLWNQMRKIRLNAKIHQERRQLVDLSERQLRDIGITRGQAYRESQLTNIPVDRL